MDFYTLTFGITEPKITLSSICILFRLLSDCWIPIHPIHLTKPRPSSPLVTLRRCLNHSRPASLFHIIYVHSSIHFLYESFHISLFVTLSHLVTPHHRSQALHFKHIQTNLRPPSFSAIGDRGDYDMLV
mgnify:CR=1 FL=1